jgi:hypothetical protein
MQLPACGVNDIKKIHCNSYHRVFEHGVFAVGHFDVVYFEELREVPQPGSAVFVGPPGLRAHSVLSAALLVLLMLHRHELKPYSHTGLAMAKVHDAKLLFERVTNAKRFEGDITELCHGFDDVYESDESEDRSVIVKLCNFEIVHQNDATKFCFIMSQSSNGGTCFRLLARDKAACRCALQAAAFCFASA